MHTNILKLAKEMKNNRASSFLKHMVSMLFSMAKSKTMAIKSKTNAMKARLIVFSLLRDKKLSLGSISQKIHAMLGHQENGGGHDDDDDGDQSKAIVLYNALTSEPSYVTHTQQAEEYHEYYEDHDKYPDLTHSLFDDQDDLDSGDPNESAIDMVRNSKEEGEEFKLEDEIDQVADLFIKKFHKRMRMQKLASFKRYQEMLERSA